MEVYLGIEIGGTKLQLAVGRGDGSPPIKTVRREINRDDGAAGIRREIERAGGQLAQEFNIKRTGVGFGGPVDVTRGRVTTSHQVTGWDGFPLANWLQDVLNVPAVIDNDCNVAALAEGLYGAGRDKAVVFYVTVGTGVGGGLIINGMPFGSDRPAIAEIGHLRPNVHFARAEDTVESLSSGLGIVASVRRLVSLADNSKSLNEKRLIDDVCPPAMDVDDACRELEAHHGDLNDLTSVQVAGLAQDGNAIARLAIDWSARTLGWAIAQVITVLAPDVVVVGGGVPQMPTELFFTPLGSFVDQYVFPPLRKAYDIRTAELGELVVVHGALALAAHNA